MNIAETGTAPANAVIADLVREYPEDTPEAAWREGASQYEARLQFARFQVRARELQAEAWVAYTVASGRAELLCGLLDEPAFEDYGPARSAVMSRYLGLAAQQKRRFEVWQALQALAFVREESQLSPEKARAGFAAVQWIEEHKADELLQSQARLAESIACSEAQHAQAEAEESDSDNAASAEDELPPTEAIMGPEWNSPEPFEEGPSDLPEPDDIDEDDGLGDDPFDGE